MSVIETFFAISVSDIDRATAFYVSALDANASFSTPRWTSLHIAGVRTSLDTTNGPFDGSGGTFTLSAAPRCPNHPDARLRRGCEPWSVEGKAV